jgi:catechol 2,3-dioxygenase-like lactoylglutathione lyase family enzyme
MKAKRQAAKLNHVSIPAKDFDESEAFFRAVLGCERIQAPNFGFPVCWLRLGDLQLHLQKVGPNPEIRTYQHFAVEVEDFTAAYKAAAARNAFETGTRYGNLWLLPGGEVQMFIRDPSDNLIEIDHPNASELDLDVFELPIKKLEEDQPQLAENEGATLFLASVD